MSNVDKLLQRAVELSAKPSSTFLELARCLAEARALDPKSMSQFIRQSRMGRRKAYYLLELGRLLPDLGASESRLKRIGWTKLQVIAKLLTRVSAQHLLGLAEEHSTARLTALVRGDASAARIHCVQLYFSPQEYHQLEQAILRNGGHRSGRGLVDKEAAIMRMVRLTSKAQRPTARTSRAENPGRIAAPSVRHLRLRPRGGKKMK